MDNFGEIKFETSRAFADDEEECFDGDGDEGGVQIGLQIGVTKTGQEYLNKGEEIELLCVFVGKVALGFGEGFLNGKNGAQLLENIYLNRGDSSLTADTNLVRHEKPVIQIFQTSKEGTILAFIDDYGLPLSMANIVTKGLHNFIGLSKNVVVFYSDTKNKSPEVLSFIKTSKVPIQAIPSTIQAFPQPNLVSGVGAAVLLFCELQNKQGLLLICSGDSEEVNSLSLAPFLNGIRRAKKPKGVDEEGIFGKLSEKLGSLAMNPIEKTTLQSIVNQSNLYM